MQRILQPAKKPPVVFLAFANPGKNPAKFLRHLPSEQRGIRKKLKRLSDAGLCEVIERANVTVEEIIEVFTDERYKDRIAIFHYGGHANEDALIWETENGSPTPAHRNGLVSFLGRQRSLKLVFLNGCLTKSIAEQLKNADIPAAIGTSSAIGDNVAQKFAVIFYHCLAHGLPINEAWSTAVDYIQMWKNTKNLDDSYFRDVEYEEHFPWIIFSQNKSAGNWILIDKWNVSKMISSETKKTIIGALISYLVTLIFDLMLGIPWREVKFNGKDLFIDRPGAGVELWLYYLLLAALWATVYYIFFYRPEKMPHLIFTIHLKYLGVLILMIVTTIFLTKFMPTGKVNYVSEISGSVEDTSSYPYLFVRPIGSTKCWLQAPIPLQPDQAGKWRAQAYFGGTSGKRFELILINSPNPQPQFSKPGGYNYNAIPRTLERFIRVVKIK